MRTVNGENKKSRILAIVGCTASGKTRLAIELAKRLNGEIISCDSMQIYREMNIGTAKPTMREMSEVPHHLVDMMDPREIYSCAQYTQDARECIRDIESKGKLPIFCGGTGLYLDRLLKGGIENEAQNNQEIRDRLEEYAKENGVLALHQKLQDIDPISAQLIHPNNVKRVIRAIEMYELTGQTKSSLDVEKSQISDEFDFTVLYLHYENREVLYDRIENRVDEMIKQGLVEEVLQLYKKGIFENSKTAAQAIGYKEFFPYINGEQSLESCIERLKINTRKYAKRQMTWFGSKDYVQKIDMMSENQIKTFENIVNISENLFNRRDFCGII